MTMPKLSTGLSPVYFSRDIRKIEAKAASLSHGGPLMESAGLAAAELARDLLAAQGDSVLVVAGSGNNGGDALVVARHLKQWWFKVEVVYVGDTKKPPHDAAQALRKWKEAGGRLSSEIPKGKWDLVIDGLVGIGLARDVIGHHAQLVEAVNKLACPVLALDVPSGLDADTGSVLGKAVRATHTVSFIALKPGLLTFDGLDYCGKVHLRNLDVDAAALLPPYGWLLSKEVVAAMLKPRPRNSHKGLFGNVGVLGGAAGMVGAALLAGRAALKLGAGRTYVALLAENAPAVDSLQPELMLRTPEELLALDLDCLAVGPGLGQSVVAEQHLGAVLKNKLPLVLDADALNLIAAETKLQSLLKKRSSSTIITPHPAEAARLLGVSTLEVQRNRVSSAMSIVKRYACHVVLKGAGSICALPDGSWYINSTGNPGMASAGMGDVLTGMIAALIAQGLNAGDAMLLAVYLHGAAADDLVTRGVGAAGLTASEVTDAARNLLNQRWLIDMERRPGVLA